MTDNAKHTHENNRTSITLLSGIFISIALFFFLILSRLLRIDKEEMNDSAFIDYTTSRKALTPGSIYITAYEGNTASLISGFTSSKWNHVAVLGEYNMVHEISSGKIKTSKLHDWREKWIDHTIIILERRSSIDFDINKKVFDLKQSGIKVNVNPVFLSGLLFGVDFDKETMYCTKFVKHILDEELPLIPSDYTSKQYPLLTELYYPPQSIRYITPR